MQAYPHHYDAHAAANVEGSVTIASQGLPSLASVAPPQYGGAGGQWSPETLLMAAVADCFVLTFRAIAHASKFEWRRIECRAAGVLDRVDGVVRFTAIDLHAELSLAAGGDERRARRLLEKAEETCLVTNSLNLEPKLEIELRPSAE